MSYLCIALFIINVYKGKINYRSILDTVGIRVLTRQIRYVSTFSVISALRHSPSTRCAIAANDVCKFSKIFNKKPVSAEEIFSVERIILKQSLKIDYESVNCIELDPDRVK
jgi:hypothetical protein